MHRDDHLCFCKVTALVCCSSSYMHPRRPWLWYVSLQVLPYHYNIRAHGHAHKVLTASTQQFI
jgi:hypothetical protein